MMRWLESAWTKVSLLSVLSVTCTFLLLRVETTGLILDYLTARGRKSREALNHFGVLLLLEGERQMQLRMIVRHNGRVLFDIKGAADRDSEQKDRNFLMEAEIKLTRLLGYDVKFDTYETRVPGVRKVAVGEDSRIRAMQEKLGTSGKEDV